METYGICLSVHGPLANNSAISCHDYLPPTAQPRDMAFFPSRTPGRLVVLVFLASAHNNLCVRVILYMSCARRRYSAMPTYMTFSPYVACCFM